MKVYEVVRDDGECAVTLYRSLEESNAKRVWEQIREYAYVEVKSFELDGFTFGDRMFLIDYKTHNIPDDVWLDCREINYEPRCSMSFGTKLISSREVEH